MPHEQFQILDTLIRLGEQALEAGGKVNDRTGTGEDVERFVTQVTHYLELLERWQAAVNNSNPFLMPGVTEAEKEDARSKVSQLGELHKKILSRASESKDTVGSEVSAVHKKAQAMKAYVDPYPGRMTITGKRTG